MNKTGFAGFAVIMSLVTACGPHEPSELTATVRASAPDAGHAAGGSIDRLTYSEAGDQVTVEGWHMLTPDTRAQTIYIYTQPSIVVESLAIVERPDVVDALGDEQLRQSGFTLVLRLEADGPLTNLCVWTQDRKYGDRIATKHSSDLPACSRE